MEEEREKRKQGKGDAVSGSRKKKAKEEGNGEKTEATKDEVEEFFAILRRIQVATSYFEIGDDGDVNGRELTEKGSRLRRRIEWECSEELNDVKSKRKESGEENVVGLDLNVPPDPE
ncbi:unnamed protein product [Ilex paraguariensis]|uniref:Uncharacterized protein n=1 Tax=Ilex paraguariensis TaxID=185542 RepID=A0ABC8SGG9_9AQUA